MELTCRVPFPGGDITNQVEWQRTSVMADLSNCTSLFELGFTLNLVSPALLAALKQSRSRALEPILAELREIAPELTMTRSRVAYFDRAIPLYYPSLRHLARVNKLLIASSLGVAIVSAVGLSAAATTPKAEIHSVLVWIYAVSALLLLPACYWGISLALGWVQDQLAARMSESPETRRVTAELFKALVGPHDFLESSKAQLDEIRRGMEEFRQWSARAQKEARASTAEIDRLLRKARRHRASRGPMRHPE